MTTPSAPSLASSSRWASTTSVSSSGKRIQREMVELNMDPPPDCCAGPKGDNLYHWIATLFGPPGLWVVGYVVLFLKDTEHVLIAPSLGL
ncbi:hypothetical protein TB2_028305 [Malus domestica]